MSLLDALLLDPWRDPRDIYIARRKDGQRGLGTIDDPYDGGTRIGPAVPATWSFDPTEIIVDAGYGWEAGSTISFDGASGPAADFFNNTTFEVVEVLERAQFSSNDPTRDAFRLLIKAPASAIPPAPPYPQIGYFGRITVDGTNPLIQASFRWPVAKVTMPGAHGLRQYAAVRVINARINGGAESHFDGDYAVAVSESAGQEAVFRIPLSSRFDTVPGAMSGGTCMVGTIHHRFDEVRRTVPTNSVIHIGQGTFETRGMSARYNANPQDYLDVYVGSLVRAGQRLLGSGMDVSIVKLVMPADQYASTTAIGGPGYQIPNGAEVANLTIDCNGPGHEAPCGSVFPAPYTCGGVDLAGSFILVRRVRVINFCVQNPSECFVIIVGKGGIGNDPPRFNVIEDCVIEKPSENNLHETTLSSIVSDGVTADAVSCIVRENYHNCEYSNGFWNHPIPIASLSLDDGLVTITTNKPHTHVKGKALVVRGMRVDGVLSAYFNGIFVIETLTEKTLSYRPYTTPEAGSITWDGATIGGPISSEQIAVGALTKPVSEEFTITTKRPHNRLPGQFVLLNGVHRTDNDDFHPYFNRAFRIKALDATTPLTKLVCEFLSPPTSFPDPDYSRANIGPAFFGRGSLSGTGCVTAGNVHLNCTIGLYQDTGSTRDLVVRDNYYANVSFGLDFDFSTAFGAGRESPPRNAKIEPDYKSLKRDENNPRIAVFESEFPHLLRVGEVIDVDGARKMTIESKVYNGTFQILSISAISPYIFSYKMKSEAEDDADPPTTNRPITLRSRWQVRRMTYESNICDFYRFDSISAFAPVGGETIGYNAGPPFMFPDTVIRENVIRHADGVSPPPGTTVGGAGSSGSHLQSFENLHIEENILEVSDAHALQYVNGFAVSGFGNRRPSGESLPILEDVQGGGVSGPFAERDTLESKVMDALLMSIL